MKFQVYLVLGTSSVPRLVIRRVRVMTGKGLSVRLATGGFVPKENLRFVRRTVLNIVVQVPVTPVAQALPAVENILNATVQQIMRGTGAVVLFLVRLRINILALVPATPVAQASPAVENILNARVQADMNGKTGLVNNKF